MLGVGILLKLGMAKFDRRLLPLVEKKLEPKLHTETPVSWQISCLDWLLGQRRVFRYHFRKR
jgi:hypothetical protein